MQQRQLAAIAASLQRLFIKVDHACGDCIQAKMAISGPANPLSSDWI